MFSGDHEIKLEISNRKISSNSPMYLKAEKQPTNQQTKKSPMHQRRNKGDFPGGAAVENPPANAGDTGSSPGLGRSHMPQSN